ncbi:MAG: enoyl-CoA hydratase/isomerase family protein [Actinomycetota bacterium]
MSSETAADVVRADRPAPHVLRITIDRPPVNAIDSTAQRAIADLLETATDDHDVRAIIITGAGRHFCAGADLREEQDIERDDVGEFLGGIGRLLDAIRHHRVPVIAAVNGAAHGGGLELALCCDIRIGDDKVNFGAAGVNVGLVANFRGLTRAIGDARARHMLLTGWSCRGQQALDWGLVTELVSADELGDRAVAIAERVASRSPLSVETTKQCMNESIDLDETEATKLQARSFARLFRTRDHAEALTAFFEKRPGVYERR